MQAGWYWYRSTAPGDPASSGTWVVLYVEADRVEVADMSMDLADFTGEWRGPIPPPDEPLAPQE